MLRVEHSSEYGDGLRSVVGGLTAAAFDGHETAEAASDDGEVTGTERS